MMIYEFKNKETYELEEAGRDGILVFKDAIFKAPFSEDGSNKWDESSLKAKLEEWWKNYASDELKEKYDVSLLTAEEVFDQEDLDYFYGSGNKTSVQLPLFANDWKAKIKRHKGAKTSCWWWLRSPFPWLPDYEAVMGADGSLNGEYANYDHGCVPALYPKDDDSHKHCRYAMEKEPKPFNKKCKTCDFYFKDERGRPSCHAFSRGTEECCEVEDFAYYQPKKGDKSK